MQCFLHIGKVCWIKIAQTQLISEHYNEASFFEKIPLTKGEYQKMKNAQTKEYFYQETLYDIHSFHQLEKEYFVLALPDKKETNLQIAYFQIIKNKDNKQKTDSFAFFPTWIYAEKIPQWYFSVQFLTELNKKNPPEMAFSPYLAVATQPPDSFSPFTPSPFHKVSVSKNAINRIFTLFLFHFYIYFNSITS
jgi:hypothetical protein